MLTPLTGGGDVPKRASLSAAMEAKQDEFYTQLSDIEAEMKHYKKHFKDKVVYLNCDDPRESNFFHYFSHNFEKLGLKKLIAAAYASQDADLFSKGESKKAVYLEYEGDKDGDFLPGRDEIQVKDFEGDGDFRSAESIALLAEADIIVTNPPFSLFRQYLAQLVEHDKKFIIIGNMNAVTYQEIWPLIQSDRLWLGVSRTGTGSMWFRIKPDAPVKKGQRIDPDGTRYQTIGSSAWFTNLDHAKRHEKIILYKEFSENAYPAYDNYDAVEVPFVTEIPADYKGTMGVPITFLGKYNPGQFVIVGIAKAPLGVATKIYPKQVQVSKEGVRTNVTKLNDGPALEVKESPVGKNYYEVDGKFYVQVYARILIRHGGVTVED